MPASEKLPRMAAIVGPTASGKSAFALRLASEFHGQIVSADSMQVYRRMDIGTAKPSPQERRGVPHHMIDILEPDQEYSAALFREQAEPIINRLHREGVPIFIAGGTGFYLKVLTHGLFHGPGADPQFRRELRERAAREGPGFLYQELLSLDPEAASRIERKDLFRIVRALEVYRQAGKPISRLQEEHGFREKPHKILKIGLFWNREDLCRRIDERVDRMIASGWVEEVRSLLEEGYSRELKSMKSIGYRHLAAYLDGETGIEEAISLVKRDTRRFAKRQMTWFRADAEIQWIFPEEDCFPAIREKIEIFFEKTD